MNQPKLSGVPRAETNPALFCQQEAQEDATLGRQSMAPMYPIPDHTWNLSAAPELSTSGPLAGLCLVKPK